MSSRHARGIPSGRLRCNRSNIASLRSILNLYDVDDNDVYWLSEAYYWKTLWELLFTPLPGREAKHCDECVRWFVCPRICPQAGSPVLRNYTSELHHFLHVTYGRGSVLLSRRRPTFGFVYGWRHIFAHSGRTWRHVATVAASDVIASSCTG